MVLELGSIGSERASRLNALVDPNAGVDGERSFFEAINSIRDESVKPQIFDAFNFASKVKYSHIGLSSAVYLLHPLRVAKMAVSVASQDIEEVATIALLHNVLEVSSVNEDILTRKFGQLVSTSVCNLTVDRALQWDVDYKDEYYNILNRGPYAARVVKVIDKLDNIFLLCMNPDDNVREAYLAEIDKYIIPMAKKNVPSVYDYFVKASKHAALIGYAPNG